MNPYKLHIQGFDYTIKYEHTELGDQYYGRINHSTCQVTVDSELPEQHQRETLLHEVLHAIDVAIGASRRVPEPENGARARSLFAWLRDPRNREAIDWIIGPGGESCQDNHMPATKMSR
jgi:hypothetical protein